MRKIRLIVVAGLVAASALVVAAPASGHGVIYGRSFGASFGPEIDPPFSQMRVDVNSGRFACRANSRVLVFKNGTLFRTARTNSAGIVFIDGPFEAAFYRVTIRRKVLVRTRRHRHICPRLSDAGPIG